MKKRPTMASLAALVDQLERDSNQSHAELRRRDRSIGRDLEHLRKDQLAQLMAWLERVQVPEEEIPGQRAATALRIGTVILVLAGLILGWLGAAAVFYYDGSRPVNIIHGLAVFVGFQLLLLILLAIALLPEKALGFLPGMQSFQDTLRMLSPGRLQRLVNHWLPVRYRNAVASFFGRSLAHQHLFGAVEKWAVVRSGQAFGVAFNLGALFGCLYLIVFTDLAFGWSTTLQADAQHMQMLTDALAWPWSSLVPQARPSLELIEATRYFRLHPGALSDSAPVAPEILGGWWPFLILCILVYGLLPRILLWLLAQVSFNTTLKRTMLHLPEIPPLFQRLNTQLVETRAPESEIDAISEIKPADKQRDISKLQGESLSVVDWSDTGLEKAPLTQWLSATSSGKLNSFQYAGGARSPEHDQQVLSSLCADGSTASLILVKAWEPPMAEFLDFLREYRHVAGNGRALAVVPLGVGSASELIPPDPKQKEVWEAAVQQLGDPWTFITSVDQKGGG